MARRKQREEETREEREQRLLEDARDRLVWAALKRWAEWLMTFYSIAPRTDALRVVSDEIDNKHERTHSRMPNAPGEHTDPTLAKLLAEEQAGHSWPASVHGIIWDMPNTHRLALLGIALGMSQEIIGRTCGVAQQRVSELVNLARGRLAISLLVLEHGRRRTNEEIEAEEAC